MDITQLILDDHHEQRRLFAMIEEIDRTDTAALAALWTRLSALLDVHAEAEELFFYPEVLKLGTGAGGADSAAGETKDAIHDQNEIRDTAADVARHDVGSRDWFNAVDKANKANSEHMGEEEREGLTDFRRHASLELRHDLAYGSPRTMRVISRGRPGRQGSSEVHRLEPVGSTRRSRATWQFVPEPDRQ
ncbi:hemerythrin domain-containing protein [uncultured Enterovirga sp.]|uniref:hemerythrin domain-containing protein n=1 Tax=uncultured Enterovirga sp. TaxID=2026352 RepID=UPI0035CC2D9C